MKGIQMSKCILDLSFLSSPQAIDMKTLVRNGRAVLPEGIERLDILVEDGRIAALLPPVDRVSGPPRDRRLRRYVLPGFTSTLAFRQVFLRGESVVEGGGLTHADRPLGLALQRPGLSHPFLNSISTAQRNPCPPRHTRASGRLPDPQD